MKYYIVDIILFILILIFFSLGFNINSQSFSNEIDLLKSEIKDINIKVDSLNRVIENKNDTLLIKVYNYNSKQNKK